MRFARVKPRCYSGESKRRYGTRNQSAGVKTGGRSTYAPVCSNRKAVPKKLSNLNPSDTSIPFARSNVSYEYPWLASAPTSGDDG